MAAKSLRVLIIRNAYQKDAGGAEQYALNLAVALKKSGHKPILVTKVGKILEKSHALAIPTIRARWHDAQGWDRGYYFRYPLLVIWYAWIILRYRIDVVHPQSRDDFVFATRAAQLLGRRVIWTDHADLKYILDKVNHPNPRMRRWVIKAAKHATAITVASQSEKQSIEAVAPDLPKLTVVYNGVFPPENVSPADKTNKVVIGTNARLVQAKGIGELLEGFAELKRKDTDLWLLGGASGNRTKYEELAKKLGIGQRIKIWDYVARPDDVVAAMDIFVHASYHEAFSLAIIEAAMLGKPIVATSVGGTPEIIDRQCGILIEPKNSTAIARALQSLLADKKLRDKLGSNAHQKAKRQFNLQTIVENQMIPLYQRKANK